MLLTVRAQPSDTLTPSTSLDSAGSPFTNFDIESAVGGGKNPERDPLMFKSGIKTEGELGELRRRKKGKQLERFHREQNEPMDEHTEEARGAEQAARLPTKIAVWASMISNFALCVLQLYAAISSESLSLLATGIDSVFDIGSNIVLYWLHKKARSLNTNKWPVGGSRLETIGNIVYGSLKNIPLNIVLYWLHKKARSLNTNKWPVGGSRLETIGNIVYGFLMASVNLVVIVESMRSIIDHGSEELNEFHLPSLIAVGAALVTDTLFGLGFLMASVNLVVIVESMRSIIDHGSEELNEFHLPSLIAVGAALGVKFLLFLYCFSLRKNSSQVHVLWEDHRNDLFINGFGLLMSAGGSKWRWWLDPTGAVIIASGVIASWSRTVYKQFELLAGKSAPHDFIKLITYKAMIFSDVIEQIDTIRAYHVSFSSLTSGRNSVLRNEQSGPQYFVEVDVVMSADTPLWRAHDLSQQLQDKIEVLPNVGRAFVHVDHETTHTPVSLLYFANPALLLPDFLDFSHRNIED
ncbi:CDF manganese transporter [Sanghuangporus baumii]|uniref:CDF manganese transporter n=1 Tax=Sanghuangporus baumii TaxID=108892 RepID=A0A9Q5N7Y3_SANBA|nr:CDF manganese transporter [Sanghuangporus baumii]